jgi:hypothetical protein
MRMLISAAAIAIVANFIAAIVIAVIFYNLGGAK